MTGVVSIRNRTTNTLTIRPNPISNPAETTCHRFDAAFVDRLSWDDDAKIDLVGRKNVRASGGG